MRTIKFPVVTDAALKPNELLAACLNPPAGDGINITEMAIRIPIAQKLRKAHTSIKLEEAEWAKLKECIEKAVFVLISEDVYAVCNAVLSAEPSKDS